ncbi:YrzA family protein [Bacillus sp. Marseille-Q3570]|uniref:YrzA family protein n=1 Tax=Bacillus sp. Marseille-Q3570 TaxID=2963522 RepID=UPI0021B76FE8|nr:YrzA family protein [Bacillus sp. Marseille-Q3570]
MKLHLDFIEDKIEFFEAGDLSKLEAAVQEKVEQNQALLLRVHHVSHQVNIDPSNGKHIYSAVVHFKYKG